MRQVKKSALADMCHLKKETFWLPQILLAAALKDE